MSNRNAIVALAALVIAIGCIMVMAVRWHGGKAPAGQAGGNVDAAPPVAAQDKAVPADAGAAVATVVDEAPPPWMHPGNEPAPATATGDADDALRQRQLRKLDESVQRIVAAGSAGMAERNQHLREALSALEALDDPAVKAQLDLDAVRDNFEISVRMQALAAKLQQIAAQPRSPERQEAIAATSAEMKALQAQLHADVRAPGSTLPPIGAVPGTATRR